MIRYRAVIFDLDGTLLDTLDDLTKSVNFALNSLGCAPRTRREVRGFVGNGIFNLMRRSVPGGEENPLFLNALDAFKTYYSAHCADNTKPYEGVCGLLEGLKAHGIRTAIVSNKPNEAVQTLKEKYFGGLIDAAVGEREGRKIKPAPDGVLDALKLLDAKKEEVVCVGDSEVDIMTGRNAGIPVISVCWGFKDEDFLIKNGAVAIAHSAEELSDIISGKRTERE